MKNKNDTQNDTPQNYKLVNQTKRKRLLLKLSLIAFASLIGVLLAFLGLSLISNFFDAHAFVKQPMIEFQSEPAQILIRPPFRVDKRETLHINFAPFPKAHASELTEAIKYTDLGVPLKGLSSIEKQICEAFGKDCKTALAVSWAENGSRQCERRGSINKNSTIDWGLFQINDIHLKKGWKLSELLNCEQNIKYAYEIYKSSGWSAWSAFNNGSYKKWPGWK